MNDEITQAAPEQVNTLPAAPEERAALALNTTKTAADLRALVEKHTPLKGIEVKDKATRETFNDEESERLLRGFLSKSLFDNGLYCRADDRGDPVIQLAPPLICGQVEFDEIEQILRSVLTEAWSIL